MRGRKSNSKQVAHALFKIGLGFVAISQGHELAITERYNLAREFIRTGKNFPNNLLMQDEVAPHPRVTASYRDLGEGTIFIMNIYGLVFILNLEAEPLLELDEQLADAHFQLVQL